jgi:hypothetical protein
MEGDDLHWRRPVLTPLRGNLDILYSRSADTPRHVIATGLDLTGVIPGLLRGGFPGANGGWCGTSRSEPPHLASLSRMGTAAVMDVSYPHCLGTCHR